MLRFVLRDLPIVRLSLNITCSKLSVATRNKQQNSENQAEPEIGVESLQMFGLFRHESGGLVIKCKQ